LTRVLRTHNGKRIVFNNGAGKKKRLSISTRRKLDPYLTPYTNNNSKWTKHLNVRPLTVKLLEENVEEKLHDIVLGNDFMDLTPKAQATKGKKKKTSGTT